MGTTQITGKQVKDAGLTDADIASLDAAKITTGTVASARLGSGGTGGGTLFLADDQTFKAPAGGSSTPNGLVYGSM